MKKSQLAPLFLLFTQFSLTLFTICSFLSPLLSEPRFHKFSLPRSLLSVILLAKLIITLGVGFVSGFPPLFIFLQGISPDLVLLSFLIFRVSAALNNILLALARVTFYSDFVVNLISLIFGINLISSQQLIMRDTDQFARFTGLFGSYYSTINISTIAFAISFKSNDKSLKGFSLLSLFFNGAQRSLINFFSLILFWILSIRRAYFYVFLIAILTLAGLVFVITVLTADSYPANSLRVSLWINALDNLTSNFWFGKQDFSNDFIPNSLSSMIDAGISESTALDTIIHRGFIVFALDISFFLVVLRSNFLSFLQTKQYSRMAPLILISLSFSEYFWGTSFCRSIYVTTYIGFLCLSDNSI